jgi:large subunit ribosomal protein L13
MKTYQPKAKDINRDWHLFDAKGQVLGRMASEIARLLMGKHKVKYANHLDMGDNVVVINAKSVELTGRKMQDKKYYRHSGYPGGLKEEKFPDLIKKHPEKVIERAVSGMLPKNRLHDPRMRRLRVFADDNHRYQNMFKEGK